MAERKRANPNAKIPVSGQGICFVISPIGEKGTERYDEFKEVLEGLIQPAIEKSGWSLRVIRADQTERPGAFINDILDKLVDSYVVIADLTGQNPNVFYELGVRHTLSPRTILIAQSLDDIPSDLRGYRAIVYERSLRGQSEFLSRIEACLKEISVDPESPDNPVLDRLPSILRNEAARLEEENANLKEQLESKLRSTANASKEQSESGSSSPHSRASRRMERILKVLGATRNHTGSVQIFNDDDSVKHYRLPGSEGEFQLYDINNDEYGVFGHFYVCVDVLNDLNLEREMSDVRVLLDACSVAGVQTCTFLIATNSTLSPDLIRHFGETFEKMRGFVHLPAKANYGLQVWDDQGLTTKELELGIKIDL